MLDTIFENCKNMFSVFNETKTHFFCLKKRAEIIAGKRNKKM